MIRVADATRKAWSLKALRAERVSKSPLFAIAGLIRSKAGVRARQVVIGGCVGCRLPSEKGIVCFENEARRKYHRSRKQELQCGSKRRNREDKAGKSWESKGYRRRKDRMYVPGCMGAGKTSVGGCLRGDVRMRTRRLYGHARGNGERDRRRQWGKKRHELTPASGSNATSGNTDERTTRSVMPANGKGRCETVRF